MTDPSAPIGQQAVRGGLVLMVARVFTGGLSAVVRIIVIANLLGPQELGLFGVSVLLLSALETFSQTGFSKALIQRPGHIDDHIDTAFTSQAIRGILLGTIMFLAAPLLAVIFQREAGLVELVRVLSIVPVLNGFNNIAITRLHRNLDFKRLALYQVGGPMVDFLVSIGHALISPTVWALVSGRIAATCVTVLVSYVLAPSRPRFRFRLNTFRELSGFGFWVLVSGVVSFLLVEGGSAAIGVMLPIAVLGIFQFADTIACRGTMLITSVLREVTFAAFARLQSESGRLRRAFRKSFARSASLVFGLTAVLVAGAPDFVRGVMTPQWEPAVPLIQLLSLWGASRALGGVSSTLFQAVGRPMLASVYQTVMLILFAVAIYPVTIRYGAVGVAATYAVIGSVVQVFRVHLLARVLGESPSTLYMVLFATLTSAVTGTICGMSVGYLLDGTGALVRLAGVVVTTGTTYAVGLLVWSRLTEPDLLPSLSWRSREGPIS